MNKILKKQKMTINVTLKCFNIVVISKANKRKVVSQEGSERK